MARRARVSVSTVSRVLSSTGRIKATTRARVLRIAQEQNYRPDIHAQALAGRKSSTLGLIVSNLHNPFFLDIFQVMEADAKRRGYEVVVANTDRSSSWAGRSHDSATRSFATDTLRGSDTSRASRARPSLSRPGATSPPKTEER